LYTNKYFCKKGIKLNELGNYLGIIWVEKVKKKPTEMKNQ